MNRIVVSLLLLSATPLPARALDRECLARIRLAEGAGFIRSYRAHSDDLDVVVDESIWAAISGQSRQGLITTLNCALRRNGHPFARIRIRSDRTREVIGEASGDNLTPDP